MSRKDVVVNFLKKKPSNRRRKQTLLNREETASFVYDDLFIRPWRLGAHFYVHSSIRGFNADYKDLIQDIDIRAKFRHMCDQQLAINNKNIQLLDTVAKEYKHARLGIGPNDELEDSPVMQAIYHKSELVRDMQRLKMLTDYRSIHYGELGQLNLDYASTHYQDPEKRAAFYTKLGQEYQHTLEKLFDSVTKLDRKDNSNPLQELKDLTQRLLESINPNATNYQELWTSKPGNLSSLLGTQWENVLTCLMQESVKKQLGPAIAEKITNIGKNNQLSDIVDKSFSVEIKNYGKKLMAGFSAKFRHNNNFDITASFQLADVFAPLKDDIKALEAIGYVYNQFAALSAFSSEYYRAKNITTLNRKKQDMATQRAWLTRTQNEFGGIFVDMARYINLFMLNVAFWGNRLDAQNIPAFAPGFFESIDDNPNSAPPAFLLTMRHPYETAHVFEKIQSQLTEKPFWTVQDLFAGSYNNKGKLVNKSAAFRASVPSEAQLRENYALKASALRRASAYDHANYDIYTVILSQPLVQASTCNILEILGDRSRAVTVRFSLMKYLHQ